MIDMPDRTYIYMRLLPLKFLLRHLVALLHLKGVSRISRARSIRSVLYILPSEVSKCLVGLRHLMGIFFFLDGSSPIVGGIQEFPCKLAGHAFFRPILRIADYPSDRQSRSPGRPYLRRHLICRTADS